MSSRQSESLTVEDVFQPEMATCPVHGDYPVNMRDSEGVIRYGSRACPACVRQAAVRKVMQRAEIAPRFEPCTFEAYQAATPGQVRALQVCRAYADQFEDVLANGRCLILRGNPGTGKNHLAVAITKAIVARGYSALHATAYEIVCRIRETWGKRLQNAETEQEVTKALGDVDLLVMDEVGRQYGTQGEQIHLFHVIDQRYRLMKPTIVISNRQPDEIRAYLGDAAYDRLREGGGVLVNFDWDSNRGSVK